MNRGRLEWVMSGLNQHVLTRTEDQFLKTVLDEFYKNQSLTELQEEKLESLYKEKSKLIPNKDKVSSKESTPKKTRSRKPNWKAVF